MSASFYLASDFYEGEPFASLPPRVTWLWIQGLSWTNEQSWRGKIPLVVVKHLCRRTWKRAIQELTEAGLWVEIGPDVWQMVRELDGKALWRPNLPAEQRPRIPNELRQRVYDRDGRTCLHCGATERLSLDHIFPYSLGGEDTYDNLQTLCKPCNSRKGAHV